MKKTLLILSMLLSVALVNAQSVDRVYGDFAYGFGMAEGQAGNSSFVMGLPFYSQYEATSGSYSVSEGVMQAQLLRFQYDLAGCQNSPVVHPDTVKLKTGFFQGYIPEEIVYDGHLIKVFPAGHYDSTAYNTGHYSWSAQFNYDSLTTLDMYVWEIYELFDTLYLDSTELLAMRAIYPNLHGGPNTMNYPATEHGCDSIVHFFVNLCGGTVRDANGNPYASVFIGTAPARYCWTKANMENTNYVGGGETPNMIYNGAGHHNETENLNTYGRLYNWYAAVNVPDGSDETPKKTIHGGFVRGICPKGWHLPDSANVMSLSEIDAFDLMSDILWLVPGHDTGAGFYALPAGFFHHATGRFEDMLGYTVFWSSVKHSLTECWVCSLAFGCNKVINDDMSAENGASVRCVKDQMYDADGTELTDLEP